MMQIWCTQQFMYQTKWNWVLLQVAGTQITKFGYMLNHINQWQTVEKKNRYKKSTANCDDQGL